MVSPFQIRFWPLADEVTWSMAAAIGRPAIRRRQDPLSSLDNAEKLNGAIKNSRKVIFDKAGYYPFLEHADRFNQLVLEFLKTQS